MAFGIFNCSKSDKPASPESTEVARPAAPNDTQPEHKRKKAGFSGLGMPEDIPAPLAKAGDDTPDNSEISKHKKAGVKRPVEEPPQVEEPKQTPDQVPKPVDTNKPAEITN